MDIIIELQSGQDMITAEPASCSVTRAVCNDSLQHVENFCDVRLVYDPDLFAFIVAHEHMGAVVKERGGPALFTGIAGTDASWTDRGEPYPIDGFSLSIKDYTAKLDIKNIGEIALLNVPLTAVLRRLGEDCALTVINGPAPDVALEAFVMPAGRSYRQTLDALCYQYRLSFYFDALGRLNFFSFDNIPDSPPPLDQSQMLAGVRVKKSRKRYDAVQVEYSTLTQKENEQVFFESFGYNSDDTPAPAIIQPGVYYPFEAAPEIEAAEGKVYQSFASGYAESRKKYNGELEFRRSRDTGLLYTRNHRVVQDWEGPLAIDREEFESLRASVRFRNTGAADARLRQFAVRADALYRNKAAAVTAGNGFAERLFSTETEFIYQAAYAEDLARSLYRFFSRSGLSVELSTDNLLIPPGSYRAVDTGKSGLTVNALVYSYTLDCEKELYAYKAISAGGAAVDVTRFKSAEADPFRGDPGEAGKFPDFRFAANASLYTPPPLDADADNPGDHWSDGPPATDPGEYLWMIKSDWRGAVRLTPWEGPTRISGPAGDAGQNAVYLDLDNENRSIACDTGGSPKPGTLGFDVQAALYDGMSLVDSEAEGVIWEVVTDAPGITINNTGTITVSANAALGDVTKVTVLALYNALPYIATLTLVKVRDGSGGLDGADAVVFALQPSVTAVQRDAAGALDPPTVSCGQIRHEGGQISVSHELLKYRLSTTANEAAYTAGQEIAVGEASWIEFALYNGAGMELDRERVPVVRDGPPGEDGLGIDALPRDAYAYWTFDNLPPSPEVIADNSGNGRHMFVTQGVSPAAGPGGRGAVAFDGTGGMLTKYPNETFKHPGDFTWSLWVNRNSAVFSSDSLFMANAESGGVGMQAKVNGDIIVEFYADGAYRQMTVPAVKVPDNTWFFLALKYNSATRVATLKVNNIIEGTVTLPAALAWASKNVPLALGGNPKASQTALTSLFYGLLSDVAVFDRLTTDDEDLALFKSRMLRDGQDGGFHALLYRRASSQPAAPTENDPPGWDANPPGGEGHLWMITGIKDALGVLQGAWSAPVQIDGEAGQYTDYRFAKNTSAGTAPAFTANADNPGSNWGDTPPATGTTEYLWMIQSDWRGTTRLTGWSAPVRISGPAGAAGATGNYHEARYMRAAARPATPSGDSPAGWTTDPSSHSGNDPLWMTRGVKGASGALQGAWSVPVRISGEDGLGFGAPPRAAYACWSFKDLSSSPNVVTDNSGNGRHMFVTQGVSPAAGPDGRSAAAFNGTGGMLTKYPEQPFRHPGSFTWSLWVNKNGAASSGGQVFIGNADDGGADIMAQPNGDVVVELYSSGNYRTITVPAAKVPNNIWFFLVLKYNSATKVATVKVNNVTVGTLTLPAALAWAPNNTPLALGGDPQASQTSLSHPFYGLLSDVAVFDRLTTDDEDFVLAPVGAFSQWDDTYIGATAATDAGNTGVINGARARRGNYVMYTGANQNGWRKWYLYQWDGSSWAELPGPNSGDTSNGWRYNNALSDVTADAAPVAASEAYIRVLQAASAFIRNLFSKIIEINSGGYIQSESTTNGERDFIIKSTGEAIFRKATIKGAITATSGSFTGTVNATSGSFTGTVNATSGSFTGTVNATGGSFKGSFLAGDAYDAAGNLVNSNSRGGMVVPSNGWRPKLFQPHLQGAVTIGDTPGSSVSFQCRRNIAPGANIITNMLLIGTLTFNQIKTQLANWGVPIGMDNKAVPVSGCLSYNNNGAQYTIIASCIDSTIVNGNWEYRLRGMQINNQANVMVVLTGTQSATVNLALF